MDSTYELSIYRKTDVALHDSSGRPHQFICVQVSRKDGGPVIIPAQSENCDASVADENYAVQSCSKPVNEEPGIVSELFTTDAFDLFKDTVTITFQCGGTWATFKNVLIHEVIVPLDTAKYDSHAPVADSAWATKNKLYRAIPFKYK